MVFKMEPYAKVCISTAATLYKRDDWNYEQEDLIGLQIG